MDGPNRLEELVNTYETTLYRAALAILGDAHEAEDAVQDAFLRCLEKAPDFESPAHARAWLLRVTVNGCKSRLRAPGGGAPPLCWTPIPPPRRRRDAAGGYAGPARPGPGGAPPLLL
ncbi:sigma-70 family RNA polymerase sigma factor [Flavonifractor plautii]|nr:sigma-70 family RNA polymerase sigma factor [Flavonifractor plautii]